MASIQSASKLLPLLLAFTPLALSYIVARGLAIPNTLPGTWISQGCYTDIGRTLSGGAYVNTTGMTEESCISYCTKLGMIYAGTEYGSECYCGMSIASGAASAPTSDCSFPCSGNSTQPCGGPNRLSLFWSNTTGPQINPGNASWAFSGCYTEGTTGRTLPNAVNTVGGSVNMTVDLCTTACGNAGYSLAGAEYSGECWCGNSISNGGILAPDGLTGCNMLCNGNLSEFCGGSGRLAVYDFNNTVSLPPYSTASSMAKPSASTSSKSSIPSTSSSSSTTQISTTSTSVSKSSSSTTLSTSIKSSSSVSSTQISSSTPGNPTSTSSSTSSKPTLSSSNPGSSSTSSSVSSAPSGSSLSSLSSSSSSAVSSIKSSSSSLIPSSSSISSTAAPITTGPVYKYIGCYTEANAGRALSSAGFAADTMTLESCQTSCAGFKYWGTEYGRECYCGNSFGAGSVPASETDCNFACAGNSNEKCGAGLRLSVYQLNSTISSVSSTLATGTSSAAPSSTTSAAPIATGFPANWTSQGCWVDGVNGRILRAQLPDSQGLTLQSCAEACAAAGYTIAGAEYSFQCFCDNYVYNGGVVATNQADCNTPCSGNSAQMCGGGGRLSMYSIGTPKVFQPASAQTSGLPTGWTYSGCLEDNLPSAQDPNYILTTFPYMSQNETSNTPASCLTLCQKYGYNAAGLEYGIQCFCGDTQNIQVASAPGAAGSYTRSRVPQVVPDSQCNIACPGDGEKICGGGNRLSWYSWNGTQPLYNFNFPTGTNAGKYELLIGGVVVPLMTSQVITGKVTFVEKYGTGEPNGTGAYELDLSQINNFNSAWRTMKGFQTDVFCSAGLTLPDRAGRQLNVGGWAGSSNYGVRLYWPDGSAGVKGVNQWIEDPNNLQLQVPRWYPSALIMANGSVLVVGGEIGQNDLAQPTLELLPPTGVKTTTTSSGYSNTTVYLDFLQRTAPFNLYPFITVLNSGIFIAYYNEARILDEKTFQTIKVLPTIPGAVNEQDGGRSYQLEGTMVTLPQYAPFTDPVTVLICGGSTPGAGYAIDNCVSTQPEAADPQWTIERMPSRRVMPCIAALPDGTYLILNGAQHGYAGFGLAYDPNFNALLYDPSKPVNSRISVMANTTVARLYHSEAILLLDGRVMVSGSDPQDDVNDPNFYPEEYRVEVFSPPYLLSGLAKPTFTITNKDWAYGASIQFTVTSGSSVNIKVSMLGSVVSTHGNSMGQRTLFPAVSCAGNTCTITAPPNAHAAPPGWFQLFVLDGPTPSQGVFVRLGGDPANLGSWPNLPAFNGQLPGTGPV